VRNKVRSVRLRYVSKVSALYGVIWQFLTKETAFCTSVWDRWLRSVTATRYLPSHNSSVTSVVTLSCLHLFLKMFECLCLPSLQVQITGEIWDSHNGTVEASNRVRRRAVWAADVISQKTCSFCLQNFFIYSFGNTSWGQICVVHQILFTNAVMWGQ